MIFIDFGLLRSLYCKIFYLLAEEHWSHTNLGIWQPTYDSVCKDNSWIYGKCRQRFLSNVYNRLFLFYPRFLTFLNVVLKFLSQRLLHRWFDIGPPNPSPFPLLSCLLSSPLPPPFVVVGTRAFSTPFPSIPTITLFSSFPSLPFFLPFSSLLHSFLFPSLPSEVSASNTAIYRGSGKAL